MPKKQGTHPRSRCTPPKPNDIIFTAADANWVHHLNEDALVIMAKIANSLVHKILVDKKSVVNILYWHAYQKIGLTLVNLSLTTSPLYGFIRGHVISKGTIKLAVTLGEHPQVMTIMTKFLVVNCPSAFNGVLGRSLL